MNIRRYISNSGFTLLELLVVVGVIGFLSSVSIVALSVSQSHSRDTQRKLDQVSIIKAAELYVNDFGVPPTQVEPVSSARFVPLALQSTEDPFLNSLLGISSVQAQLIGPGGPGPGSCGIQVCPNCFETDPDTCQCVYSVDACSGGGGSPTPVCGNTLLETGEQCDDGNTFSGDGCSSTCDIEGSCNSNGVCEPALGENVGNCANDCNTGVSQGAICGLNGCEPGETPATCSEDCSNTSMCYYAGEWDLCCLFGGSYCDNQQSGDTGGYYGVCNVDSCEVKYFLQKPSFTCSSASDCLPGDAATPKENKMVSNTDSNWLRGLEPYTVTRAVDPCSLGKCHKVHPSGIAEKTDRLNRYWVSSHFDVVRSHLFCVYIALEDSADNVAPYSDIVATPTGDSDWGNWSVLCLR